MKNKNNKQFLIKAILIIAIILASTLVIAAFDKSDPWHPLNRITIDDAGTKSVDDSGNNVIDLADRATIADTATNANQLGGVAADLYVTNTALTTQLSGLDADDNDWTQASGNVYRENGNVGIGTTTPGAKLHVVGDLKVDGRIIGSAGNLILSDSWNIGTGGVDIFSSNGGANENVREWNIGPHGNRVILWKAVPDAVSGADGGWVTDYFPIDHTKTYRYIVWIKKTGSNGGSTYLGTYGGGAHVTSLTGTVSTNPYFWSGDLPELNKWYLLVGYVHGSGDTSTTSYGGIYDGETGKKLISMTDYKFQTTTTTSAHRSYLYYDVTTTNRQYWWDPRVEQVNGNEPTIEALLGLDKGATQDKDKYFGGNVGIGTATPDAKLHVAGDLQVDGDINIKQGDEVVALSESFGGDELDCYVAEKTSGYSTSGYGTVSVKCKKGYKVTGGGCNYQESSSLQYGIEGYPDGNGWTCRSGQSGSTQPMTVYAKCCKAGDEKKSETCIISDESSISNNYGTTIEKYAMCKSGSTIRGCYDLTSKHGCTTMMSSAVSGKSMHPCISTDQKTDNAQAMSMCEGSDGVYGCYQRNNGVSACTRLMTSNPAAKDYHSCIFTNAYNSDTTTHSVCESNDRLYGCWQYDYASYNANQECKLFSSSVAITNKNYHSCIPTTYLEKGETDNNGESDSVCETTSGMYGTWQAGSSIVFSKMTGGEYTPRDKNYHACLLTDPDIGSTFITMMCELDDGLHGCYQYHTSTGFSCVDLDIPYTPTAIKHHPCTISGYNNADNKDNSVVYSVCEAPDGLYGCYQRQTPNYGDRCTKIMSYTPNYEKEQHPCKVIEPDYQYNYINLVCDINNKKYACTQKRGDGTGTCYEIESDFAKLIE